MTCAVANAQGTAVKGRVVYDADKQPIIAATIMVVGTQTGAVTDMNGDFTIPNLKDGDILKASYVGLSDYELTVDKSRTTYIFSLKEDTQIIDEVVVVGYGTMRKKEVTGAVARVDAQDLTRISTSDVGNALQGQIAGVNVQASSGQPGSTSNIQIRGISSVNGSNSPLYVVDGVPFESDPGLSPNEIESIDVLKDAASSAIYGTRGAGGVILISTKSGKEGQAKISADVSYGVQKITSGLSLINSAEYMYLQSVVNADSYLAPNYSYSTLWNSATQFSNDSNLLSVVEQDMQPIINASITASGGNKGLTYSLVASYFNQDGVIINSGYERINLRANSTLKRNKWTVTANLSSSLSTQDSPAWGLYNNVYQNKPTSQMIDPDVSIAGGSGDSSELTSVGNTLASFKQTTENQGRGFNFNGSIAYEIMPGLSLSNRVGTGFTINKVVTINPLFEVYDSDGELVENSNTRSKIKEEYRESVNFSNETMLNYSFSKNKHDIKATGVFSIENYTYESFYTQVYDLVDNDLASVGSATGETLSGVGTGQWGQDRTSVLVGMLGRVQYNYDSRYMLSASIRRDASSRFAKENRWGNFPSVSAGWNISEESFFKPLTKVANGLKLRASYGTTGNQNFIDYAYESSIYSDYNYAFAGSDGDALSLGSTQTAYSNVDVKWETTEQINLGVDVAFLKSKLTLTADVYRSSKKDMLFPLKVPPVAGTGTSGSVILNMGNMENNGVEVALHWRDSKKGFNYWANGTFSTNENIITEMSGSNKRVAIGTISTPNNNADDVIFLAEGYEAASFFMMPTDGIINTDAELEAYQKYRSDAEMGDLKYVDQNGDGEINDDDRVYCGSGTPEFELGFNAGASWKGIDFSMGWYASLGNEIINGSKVVSYQNGVNRDLLYCWSPDNPTSSIPKYTGVVSHYNTRAYADTWVEDGSYLRLRNVSLGYTLPKNTVSKIGISKLRVYVAADNLLTLTKYDGYDPEVGNDGLSQKGLDNGNYPVSAQMRVGVQLEF